jgi:hypothetical protein
MSFVSAWQKSSLGVWSLLRESQGGIRILLGCSLFWRLEEIPLSGPVLFLQD